MSRFLAVPVFWVCLLAAGCGGSREPAGPIVLPVKITQFYASPNPIPKGEKGLLCYGVEAASSVTLEPPIDKVWPTLSRCIEINPTAETEYKLTAVGRDGKTTVTATVKAGPGAARPKFADLHINSTSVKPGEAVAFCFKGLNGTAIAGAPGRFQRGGNPAADCLLDNPRQTTTYRLELTGPGGSDSASISVSVL